jgi:outer membrane protein assembly factor BamB
MRELILRRLMRGAAAGLILAALGACSLFSRADPRMDPAELTEYPPGLTVRQVWRTSIGSGSGVGFAPIAVGEAVYAATPKGKVGKYALSSGNAIWTADAGIELSAGVGSDGETTAVASPNGDVIAFDDSGKVKWKVHATSNVSVPPVVGYGAVVVRSGDYRIQALDLRTGERLWSVQRPGPALALQSNAQMVMAEGLVIVGLPGGKLLAIDISTGNVQWEGTVSAPRGATDLERLTDVVGAPKMAGRLLCAVAYQGRITCFDVSAGGRPIWAKDFSSSSGMTVDEHNAYASDDHGSVAAFSLDGGANLWTQKALRNRRLTAPAAISGTIAVGDFDGYVHMMSAADGKLLGRLALGGGAIVSPPLTTSYGVLFQTGNGDLVMVGTR